MIEEVETQWNRGVFDTQRIDDASEALLAWLMTDNYLRPKISGKVDEIGADERRVVFHIDRGTRFTAVRLAFEGARGIDPKVLDDIINEQDLEEQLFTDPLQVTTLLERYYREQGYLTTEIEEPVYEFEGTVARSRLGRPRRTAFLCQERVDIGQRGALGVCAFAGSACRQRRSVSAVCGRERARAHPRSVLAARATTMSGPTTRWLSIARPAAST